MSQDAKQEFTGWRSYVWPVHNHEYKKLIPMLIMAFCISFNYTILRDAKDGLVVTAPGSGAEAIPFLKVYGVVPCALIYMIIYTKLSNTLSREGLFYAAIAPFLVFFSLFSTVIYPLRDVLHPTTSADALQAWLPAGLSGVAACYRNWSYALFYIMAELWGSAVLSLLFWGFANQITKISEAKRFYTIFGIGFNVALLVSGPAIVWVSNIRQHLPEGVDAWQISLNYLMGMVVVAAILVVISYYWMNRNVLCDAQYYDPTQIKGKKSKLKMSLGDSFKLIFNSKYLGCLTVLVIAYGIAINLVEVSWKAQLKESYSNPNDYLTFMGYFSTATGAVTVLMLIFVGGNVIRSLGWKIAAMITPIILLVTGGGFFGFVLFKQHLQGLIAVFGTSPLMLAVLFGAAQNIMSKSSKYSLFDPTKEIAYIPLDEESKVKGKAAVDVVGARLGKSGGSLIQQFLLFSLGSVSAIGPYICGIMLFIIAAWLWAANSLGNQFLSLSAKREEEAKLAAAEAKAAAPAAEEAIGVAQAAPSKSSI